MATQVRPRWNRRRQAGESHPYSTPRLCQLQDHNHQDDDHQHPDNDANYASVHFASVKFPWPATLPVRSCMSEPSEDCRVLWLDSSNAWIRAVKHGLPYFGGRRTGCLRDQRLRLADAALVYLLHIPLQLGRYLRAFALPGAGLTKYMTWSTDRRVARPRRSRSFRDGNPPTCLSPRP